MSKVCDSALGHRRCVLNRPRLYTVGFNRRAEPHRSREGPGPQHPPQAAPGTQQEDHQVPRLPGDLGLHDDGVPLQVGTWSARACDLPCQLLKTFGHLVSLAETAACLCTTAAQPAYPRRAGCPPSWCRRSRVPSLSKGMERRLCR